MDMLSEEIIQAIAPAIQEREFFYTAIFRNELIKIADEYSDNSDEKIATQQVIDSIHAVIKIEGSHISMSFECDNEPWFTVMNEGMDAPYVNGETVDLPQGGQRKSKASSSGGYFSEGSEPGSTAQENAMKLINSLFPEDIKEIIASDELVSTIIKGRLSEEIQKVLGGNAS